MIPTRVHGVLDYIVAVALILVGVFVYGPLTTPGMVPIVMGAATILYSLMTNYELGAVKLIPMRGHLVIDLVAGVLLAGSPWLLRFADVAWMPHVLVGLMELVVVALSARVPSAQAGGAIPR